MARYIDADKVSEKLKRYLMPNVDIDGTVTVEVAERYLLELINKTPTADVVEVKHGEWIYNTDDFTPKMRCIVCGYNKPMIAGESVKQEPNDYCNKCGAKMDGTPKERGGEK